MQDRSAQITFWIALFLGVPGFIVTMIVLFGVGTLDGAGIVGGLLVACLFALAMHWQSNIRYPHLDARLKAARVLVAFLGAWAVAALLIRRFL